MTTTTGFSRIVAQEKRFVTIAARLEEYSTELEEFASDLEDGPACDALFQVARGIDEARRILEKIKLA
jgi:hypothetical protein